jgi:circadian clock protein KaiB
VMETVIMKLYITGQTGRSIQAVKNLKSIVSVIEPRQVKVDILDTLEDPEKAEEDKVLATPTLIAISGDREKRIIGNLSNHQQVLTFLGFSEKGEKIDSWKTERENKKDEEGAGR